MHSLGQGSSHMQVIDDFTTTQQFCDIAESLIAGVVPAAPSAPKNKRKHNTLTLADKYGIILRLEQGESSAALCREFNIGRSTLHDIRTNRIEIEKFITSSSQSLHDRKTLKKGDYPDVEEALYSWYNEEKSRSQITGDLLKEKGKYFFSMIHKRDDFQASEGWLDKFKKRFGIRLSAIVDRQPTKATFVVPALVEAPVDYRRKFLTTVEQHKLLPDQVYFAFGGIINCTNLPTGICQRFAPLIHNVAVMPCANVTGKHKLPLLIVGNNQLCSNSPDVANYVVQGHIDISAEVLQEWYLEQFVPTVMKYLKKQKIHKKSLLVVANISTFPDEADMKIKTSEGLIDVMFVPDFSADVFKTMGEGLISTMKTLYKKRLLMDFLSKPFTRIDSVMQKYSAKEAVCNLAYAWQIVPQAKLANYWLEIWRAVADSPEFRSPAANAEFVNGTDTEIEAVINLFCSRHIHGSGSLVTCEELRAWLDLDCKSEPEDTTWLQNQELVSSDQPVISPVTCDEAVSAVNTLLKWADEQSVEISDVLSLKKLQEKVIVRSFCNNHSATIHKNVLKTENIEINFERLL